MTQAATSSAISLARQALVHGGIALLLAALLIGADVKRGRDGVTAYLVAAWAFLTGLALSHIVHEWCHFLGARAARSALTLKPRIHPLFFDYDFAQNTPAQFLCLSIGGLLGNLMLLCVALLCAGPQSLGDDSFPCGRSGPVRLCS
ncbi:hypothetical protein [Rhodoferax sp.]|uniref:hypothetical protein n=1 Tax=Rhodoferax sp. TaxID=50421 RepID=UPI002ACEBE5B|nr:hypothetical protein [Rhodoferax sp.]MDZ7921158.1 hypothetical protein [Rhodoferax sp.]